jgi:hypothetical protein
MMKQQDGNLSNGTQYDISIFSKQDAFVSSRKEATRPLRVPLSVCVPGMTGNQGVAVILRARGLQLPSLSACLCNALA